MKTAACILISPVMLSLVPLLFIGIGWPVFEAWADVLRC